MGQPRFVRLRDSREHQLLLIVESRRWAWSPSTAHRLLPTVLFVAHQFPAFPLTKILAQTCNYLFIAQQHARKSASVPTLLRAMRNPDFSTGLPSDFLRVTLLAQG